MMLKFTRKRVVRARKRYNKDRRSDTNHAYESYDSYMRRNPHAVTLIWGTDADRALDNARKRHILKDRKRVKRKLPIVGDPDVPKNPEPRLLQIQEPEAPEWQEPEADHKEIPGSVV